MIKKNGPPKLILFDGATGAGKSTLLKSLRAEYSASVFVGTKLTTRKKRDSDNDWEFRFVEQIPQQYASYSFKSVGHFYAIDYDQLERAINQGLIYAISCVDHQILKILISKFEAITIYIYRSWTSTGFEALLASRGTLDSIDSKSRRDEVALIPSQYLDKVELYDHVLLNVGSESDIFSQLSKILLLYGIAP